MHDFRKIMTLLAGFVIGIHIAVVLHELGHALGCILDGGYVSAIVMKTPLPAGHVEPRFYYKFGYVWGGVGFGTLATLPVLAIARRFFPQSPIHFAAMTTAAFCLANNGIYLFLGGVAPFGDAEDMVRLGAPRLLLFLLSLPLLAGFICVLSSTIRLVGLRSEDSPMKWVAIAEAGLLPIPALMSVGGILSRSVEPSTMLVHCACYAVGFGAAALRARNMLQSLGKNLENAALPENWRTTGQLFVGALLVLAMEWLVFGKK
jgi:hypothetical protein